MFRLKDRYYVPVFFIYPILIDKFNHMCEIKDKVIRLYLTRKKELLAKFSKYGVVTQNKFNKEDLEELYTEVYFKLHKKDTYTDNTDDYWMNYFKRMMTNFIHDCAAGNKRTHHHKISKINEVELEQAEEIEDKTTPEESNDNITFTYNKTIELYNILKNVVGDEDANLLVFIASASNHEYTPNKIQKAIFIIKTILTDYEDDEMKGESEYKELIRQLRHKL